MIRHGQTKLNKENKFNGRIDEPLTDEGFVQARKVSLNLPDDINHICSSSMIRAKQTAETINKKFNIPITLYKEIIEVDAGINNGTVWDTALKEKYRLMDYDFKPKGESFLEVKDRVSRFLKDIKDNYADRKVLIVTHGGIIRMINYLAKGSPLGDIKNVSFYTFNI